MSDKDRPDPPDGDDAVGYGRPPRRTRFGPGRSGNPKGRPKGSRGVDKMLRDALFRRVRILEDGKVRWLTVQEVIIQRVVNDAARMNPNALKILLSLISRYEGTTETSVDMKALSADDQAILTGYMAEQKELGA
ncbi:MAG: DUF5681 domain-containing protein, partial [Roseiarcus sp.]